MIKPPYSIRRTDWQVEDRGWYSLHYVTCPTCSKRHYPYMNFCGGCGFRFRCDHCGDHVNAPPSPQYLAMERRVRALA